ncbi:ornithine decarboxylase-like [Triticum dicoccoides]|uniref:ornithine decarboxylase-like n=1 Tax=Triticum dicoccoides TaxID=85692 RepID=UPI001890F707|nr:ornithine decarboxylase-like [Triticum dicoccoides]
MARGSTMQTAVLGAPGVKGRKVRALKRNDKDAVAGLIRSIAGIEEQGAFFVFDLAAVVDLYSRWCRALDGVRPYYAVKCNPEPAMLGAMAALGAGFDCASRAEIEAVLALGVVEPGSIVYANPCKPEAHLRYAAEVGVNLTTYDTEDEVAKVKRCHPSCDLLLRIKGPDNPDAKIDLGTKYGARADEVVPLLRAAQRAGLRVAGVAFHVGACTSRVDVYRGAIEAARVAFDAAAQLGMPPMRVLDIGGGFMPDATFDGAAEAIGEALAQHFPRGCGVDVISEPGQYFAERAFTLAARVIGRRTRGEARQYWIDDGIYGALSCTILGDYVPRPRPLTAPHPPGGEKKCTTYASTVFGPTCDSRDKVVTGYQLPEMNVGDWVVFDGIGAYAASSGSNFNGFLISDIKTHLAYSA